MERIILARGGRYNLETLFTDLQNYAYGNLTNFIGLTFSSFGVNAKTTANGLVDDSDDSLLINFGANNTLYVTAGEALTSGLHYINVPTTSIAKDDSLPDGTNSLYVKYKPIQDKFVDVIKGGFTTPGAITTPYRETGSYEFVWNTNPSVSGVWLADVIKSGTNWTQITDKRHTNVLKLSTNLLPDTVVRTDRTYTQELTGTIEVPQLSVKSGANELRITPGESGLQTLSGSDVANFKNNSHTQNADTGTTSTAFRIGVGTYGANKEGLLALTTADTVPEIPLNFKVTDITSVDKPYYLDVDTSLISQSVQNGTISPYANVHLSWNYDNIVGSGGWNSFTITSGTWTTDQLDNYLLYLPNYNGGDSVLITSNSATSGSNTLLAVTTINGSNVNLSGIVANSANYGYIYTDADKYEISAVPVKDGIIQNDYRTEIIVSGPFIDSQGDATTITTNKYKFPLLVGQSYYIDIVASKTFNKSNSVRLASGTYTKDSNKYTSASQSYASPLVLTMPTLKTDGVYLVAYPKPYGFLAQIVDNNKWSEANNFEFVWTPDNNGASFTDSNMSRMILSEKTLRATVNDARRYNIKVRPLMAGQSVLDTSVSASGIQANILSGGGGTMPDVFAIAQFPATHRTYSGVCDIDYYSNVPIPYAIITLNSGIYSPANGTDTVSVGSNLIGEVLTIGNGTEYVLYSYMGRLSNTNYQYFAWARQTNLASNKTSVSYNIGTTWFGRLIHRSLNLPKDYEITNVYVDCDILTGSSVMMRWYQGKDADDTYNKTALDADYLEINLSDTGFSADSDVQLLQQNGARNLFIDFWDNGVSPDNYSGFDGTITVYAKTPVVKPDLGDTSEVN